MTFALILTVLKRRWKTIAVFVLIGMLGGIALWGATATKYAATTSLVVSAGVSNPFTGTKEEVNIRTEQEILGSREVAQRASEALGVKLAPGSFLLSQVDVAAPSGSQVLQVTVSAGSPEEAAQAADALSEAYLDFRREGADTVVNGYLEKIDAQLAELQSLERDEATNSLIETLQQQRLSLVLTTAEPGRIIGEAEVPTSPSTPGLTVSLAGGLVGGMVLGIAAALVRERNDDLVRSVDRLARVSGSAPLVSADQGAPFWSSLTDHIAEASGSGAAAPRVLSRAVGFLDSGTLSARLQDAMDADAEGLSEEADPWTPAAKAEPESRRSSTAPQPRVRQGGARVIDVPGEASSRSFARLAARADVVVLFVSGVARLAEVSEAFDALHGVDTRVIVAFHPRRDLQPAWPNHAD